MSEMVNGPRGGGGGRRGGGGMRGGGVRFGGGGGPGVRSFSGRGGFGFRRFGGGGRGRGGGRWRRPWRRPWDPGWGYSYWGYPWSYYPTTWYAPQQAQPSRLAQNAEVFADFLDDASSGMLVDDDPNGAANAFGAILKYTNLWGYSDACAGTRMTAAPPTSQAAGRIARTLAEEIRISISDNSDDEILAAICRASALANVVASRLAASGFTGTGAIM